MIPKPPFLKDLAPEQEAAEFEALKPRLAGTSRPKPNACGGLR